MGHLKSKKATPTFSKESLDISPVNREWRNVEAQDIQHDDIISGLGKVMLATETCGDDIYLSVGDPNPKDLFFKKTDVLLAFVKRSN